jgi:hypothetical protein
VSAWAEGTPPAVEPAGSAEARFLHTLRRRVAWQSDTAARLRGGPDLPTQRSVDVLYVPALARLVDTRPGDARAAEWQSFVDDLRVLADSNGRLHEDYGCLVRAVLGDLLD